MFFSQTVRRDDEDDKSDVIGRALGAGRDLFDQRIGRAKEGSENDDQLRWLGPVTSHRSSNLKDDQFVSGEPSIGRRISRTLARFLFVVLIGVGITLAWQSYREEAKEVVRTWVPSLGWVLPPTVKLAASAEASPELGQQLKPIALDLALVRRSVEQLAGDLKQLSQARADGAEPRDTTGGRAGPQTEHFISASICGSPDSKAQTHATPSAVTGYAVSVNGRNEGVPVSVKDYF